MNDALTLFDYTFVDNKADNTLFLLHGTGGSKQDMLFFDDLLEKKYNLVSLKGNVVEQGMTRFFKRLSLGVFDQTSIKIESEKFHAFISAWKKEHSLSSTKVFGLGYSNGANMLLATVFKYPEAIQNLVLLHPMLPFLPTDMVLKQHAIFMSYSFDDQMISEEQSLDLIDVLIESKAQLSIKEYSTGHEISPQELNDVIKYLGISL